MNALVLTSIAAVSTTVGGYCSVLLRRRIYLLMALGAGILCGAACFDLLPAALSASARLGSSWGKVAVAAGAGAVFFYFLRGQTNHVQGEMQTRFAGRLSAALLVLHSSIDGSAIFAATMISTRMGVIVGLGIIAHDTCDGLNTVLLSSGGRPARRTDYIFLALDAAAPVLGGLIAGHLFTLSPVLLIFFLSFAAGSFLYTGTLGLFLDSYREHRSVKTIVMAFTGFLLIWCLTRVLGSLE